MIDNLELAFYLLLSLAENIVRKDLGYHLHIMVVKCVHQRVTGFYYLVFLSLLIVTELL